VALTWVRVRTLGEFVFCPRAGILSQASADDDDEPADERMNLDYLPEYNLALIEEELAVQLRRLAWWAVWSLCALFFFGASWWNDLPPILTWALAGPAVLCVWKTCQTLAAVIILSDRRREALSAKAIEPPSDLKDDHRVDWWELLKAGFESVAYLEPLRDEEWALAGKPWRVLKKGSLRIPVIRLPADNYHAGRYWVYEQHRIRLAAYAHLISECEGGQTPYGVILFGGSTGGVAVPILSVDVVVNKLDDLQRALDLERMHIPTPIPTDTKVCSGCPLGAPRVLTASDRNDAALGRKIHAITGPDGKAYRCDCGDRFKWIPPHRDAVRRGVIQLV